MTERLLGVETEYALSAVRADGSTVDRMAVLGSMLDLAREQFATLPDGTGRGVFLPNGARFYIDVPDHPEFATPECADPWEVVRYQRAGDRLLSALAAAVANGVPEIANLYLLRCNVDYSGAQTTWGQHENYMHTCDPGLLPAQLVPHLVSRIVYTGAGGFNSLRSEEVRFTLSPRVWHLEATVSGRSQSQRGIFHSKQESLSGAGYHRLHVLAGETLASDTAAWLKVATTALVVAMIDGGLRPGDAVSLKSPLRAMRLFASDPTCRAAATVGTVRRMRAVEIQRHYLQLAEDNVHADFMPSWAEEGCRRWREMLDLLEDAPGSVATKLDWAIKRAIYERHLVRHGATWKSLDRWNHVSRDLAGADLVPEPEDGSGFEMRDMSEAAVQRLMPHLLSHGMTLDGLREFAELRHGLFELDARFAQLGRSGVFEMLDRAGVLAHAMPGVDDIDRAMQSPPAVGRARLRGAYVTELAVRDRGSVYCDWSGIWDRETRRTVDLRDPFATRAEWGEWIGSSAGQLPHRGAIRLRNSTPDTGAAAPGAATPVDGAAAPHDAAPVDNTAPPSNAPRSTADAQAQALEDRGDHAAAEPLRRQHLAETEQRRGSEHIDTALACNQLAVLLRTLGRPAEAEPLSRRALRIDEAARPVGHPKIPHRLNNLAVVLLMQCKVAQAKEHLARAWQLKSGAHDITSARILWTRLAAALMRDESGSVFLGLMRSVLAMPRLPTNGDVIVRWAVEPILNSLRPYLSAGDAELLARVGEAVNDRALVGRLDTLPAWREQPALPVATPWPAQAGRCLDEPAVDAAAGLGVSGLGA